MLNQGVCSVKIIIFYRAFSFGEINDGQDADEKYKNINKNID